MNQEEKVIKEMATEKRLLQEIHIKVIRIEEHMKNQNSKVFENKSDIKELNSKIPGLTMWNRIQTLLLVTLSGACGFMLEYILSN